MYEDGMTTWPDGLIEELADGRCIVFIGSGVSNSVKFNDDKRIPTWRDFLEKCLVQIHGRDKEQAKQLIEIDKYLDALQIIKDRMDPKDYKRILKNYFTVHIRNISDHGALKPIFNLNLPVIVSTNFDTTYEDYCVQQTTNQSYNVVSYDKTSEIIGALKSSEGLILKAHGTIKEADNLIFTKNEYYKFMRNCPAFFTILKSLFLTRTILFIGYSLNDPDINILLNRVNGTDLICPSAPHYILLNETDSDKYKLKHWKNNFNILPVFYKKGSEEAPFENFVPVLDELHSKVLNEFAHTSHGPSEYL